MTITACIVALSLSRKVKPREIQILLKALKNKDSQKFALYFENLQKFHPKCYENFIKKEMEVIESSQTK